MFSIVKPAEVKALAARLSYYGIDAEVSPIGDVVYAVADSGMEFEVYVSGNEYRIADVEVSGGLHTIVKFLDEN